MAFNVMLLQYNKITMRQPTKRPSGILPKIDLIATLTPESKVVHTELGVTTNPAEGIAFATKMIITGVVDNIEYVKGEDVGLEWWTHDGVKLPQSDEWAQQSYVAVTDVTGEETFSWHGQPLTQRGLAKQNRRYQIYAETHEQEGNLYEWLDHLENCHDLWERIKSGRF